MYILWSSDVHQKWEKRAGNWAKMVRLDKMSRRNEGWTGTKVYVWTKCPNKKWEEYGIKNY